jgi:hypothetical protein
VTPKISVSPALMTNSDEADARPFRSCAATDAGVKRAI